LTVNFPFIRLGSFDKLKDYVTYVSMWFILPHSTQ
jgi:hypothetical protein